MQIPDLIKQYLAEAKVMQLATASNNQPWNISVHFVIDDRFNFYWLSKKDRRHSQEIAVNPTVAVTVPIRYPENPLVGISAEGVASMVNHEDLADLIKLYDERFHLDEKFKSSLFMGTQDHELYKLTTQLFVLYDEIEFPENPRQEWFPAGNS